MTGDFCPLCGGEGDKHLDGCNGPDIDTGGYPFYCTHCGEELTRCTCGVRDGCTGSSPGRADMSRRISKGDRGREWWAAVLRNAGIRPLRKRHPRRIL